MTRIGGSGGGNPILIGAVTVLVTVIAVFLAYNANAGLPFVPTYDVSVQVPNAAGLVAGNDVRVGGKRVGTIDRIVGAGPRGHATRSSSLKLDKTIEPLHDDSRVTVRPRSPLGLKYLELAPGTRGRKIAQGGTPAGAPGRAGRGAGPGDQHLRHADAPRAAADPGPGRPRAGGTRRRLQRRARLRAAARAPGRSRGAQPRRPAHRPRAARCAASGAWSEELAPVAPQLGSLIEGADRTMAALASVSPQLAGHAQRAAADRGHRHARARRDPAGAARRARARARDPPRHARAGRRGERPARRDSDRHPGAAPRQRAQPAAAHRAARGLPAGVGPADPRHAGAAAHRARLPDPHAALRRPGADEVQLHQRVPAQHRLDGLRGRRVRQLAAHAGGGQRTRQIPAPSPAPDLHANPYPNTAAPGQTRVCEAGNEPYLPGQQIGHVPGNQGTSPRTPAPPAGGPAR